MPKKRVRKAADEVVQLKVSLTGVEPTIWRRLLVRSDTTLAELHTILNEAMGWTNSHLHAFEVDGERYCDPTHDPELHMGDERKIRLSPSIPNGAVFIYEYDFGDGWEHEVVVESRVPHDHRVAYPVCIGGERAGPPDDCGGVHGYAELLAALADPKHDEHDTLTEWIGGYFDPEGFDANRVNRALSKLRR